MKIVLRDNANSRFNIKVIDGRLEIEADGLQIDNQDTDVDLIKYYVEVCNIFQRDDPFYKEIMRKK